MYVLWNHFSIFSLKFNEIQLEESLWHFRMSLLKTCSATRCSYKCTVNPHWIHVSRESSGEMKLCLSSKIIMWSSVPQTVRFFVMENVWELSSGGKRNSGGNPKSIWVLCVCIRVRSAVHVWDAHEVLTSWIRFYSFTSEQENLTSFILNTIYTKSAN